METNQTKDNGVFKIKGDWDAQSKQLKEKFPQLTETDLKFEVGTEKELLGRISARLNKKREEVINIITEGQTQEK